MVKNEFVVAPVNIIRERERETEDEGCTQRSTRARKAYILMSVF